MYLYQISLLFICLCSICQIFLYIYPCYMIVVKKFCLCSFTHIFSIHVYSTMLHYRCLFNFFCLCSFTHIFLYICLASVHSSAFSSKFNHIPLQSLFVCSWPLPYFLVLLTMFHFSRCLCVHDISRIFLYF